MKKIISTALMVVILFTTIVTAIPLTVNGAYSPHSSGTSAKVPEGTTEANYTSAELTEYLEKDYLEYNFETPEQMLEYELEKGLLYYVNSANNYYTLYVNKYTGLVYYVNNVTGQILTSNPSNPGYINTADGTLAVQYDARTDLMSQITVSFFESANSLNSYVYTSYQWGASRSQITISPIQNGFRVNYVLGDTTTRFLLPGEIKAEKFENNILFPMLTTLAELLDEYCKELYPEQNFSFLDNEDYVVYNDKGTLNKGSGSKKDKGLLLYISDMQKLYRKLNSASAEYERIDSLRLAIIAICNNYNVNYPAKGDKDGFATYVYSGFYLNETKRTYSEYIKKYAPDYTFAQMFEDEKECGYVDNTLQKPVIRCALEYVFNSDGSLSVRLPANSITFDETTYTLSSITPLRHFGCADVTDGGYIFYPDGSGTIVEFEDFYDEASNKKINLSLSSNVYGSDFAYSNISGAHREQIIMPVFGIVNGSTANSLSKHLYGVDTVTDGFFAVLEEGSALATLGFSSGGTSHVYASAYASYNPYPSDVYDLSDTISVGSLGTYTIVSDSKYSGSYVTRYVMLTDEAIGDIAYGEGAYYKTDYVGMASYYRDYLKNLGVLDALEIVSDDLPLYIELLGSMEIVDRVLTFPVNKSIPLTTFEDAVKIYEQLSNCKVYVQQQLDDYRAKLEKEEDDNLILQYTKKVEHFEQLLGCVEDTIDNINFKLTGFANGGVSYTYPVKVKWEKACGGKNGFATLIGASKTASTSVGKNFSVYPDFDFMYIINTAPFDGISNKGNVSKMVDNRYASKQVYNAVTRLYESFFTLVITPDALDSLYTKFEKQYSKFGHDKLSVSTMGSALNSNFDEEAPVNREEAREHVINTLDRMSESYDLMLDTGNVYALKYATHVLNVPIDSSHFRYSSYAIPFVGLVLHSYVNYTGAPLNYSGMPEYDLLRSIENGASLYYILCYQNTSYMKDDKELSKYYGIDYVNWYDEIVKRYAELNAQIGSLQSYEIVDHRVLIAERVIEEKESKTNTIRLMKEALELIDAQALVKINEAHKYLRENHSVSEGLRVKFVMDKTAIMTQLSAILNIEISELMAYPYVVAQDGTVEMTFSEAVDKINEKYSQEYVGNDSENKSYVAQLSALEYSTKYSYVTDSYATDKNYQKTDYTVDNGNVTMVTYKKGDKTVSFVLNYNNFAVTVKLEGREPITLEKHAYEPITH